MSLLIFGLAIFLATVTSKTISNTMLLTFIEVASSKLLTMLVFDIKIITNLFLNLIEIVLLLPWMIGFVEVPFCFLNLLTSSNHPVLLIFPNDIFFMALFAFVLVVGFLGLVGLTLNYFCISKILCLF